jgi:hypothetical protein
VQIAMGEDAAFHAIFIWIKDVGITVACSDPELANRAADRNDLLGQGLRKLPRTWCPSRTLSRLSQNSGMNISACGQEFSMMSIFLSSEVARSQIEREILDHDLSLSKINEDRLRLAVQLAKCKLTGQSLAARRQRPRSRSDMIGQRRSGSAKSSCRISF